MLNMLFRALLLMMLTTGTLVGESPQSPPKREIPCKIPANQASCYWVHGRLDGHNGNPVIRLWKVGTHRMLGIFSGPDAEKHDELDNEHPELPKNLDRVFEPFQNRIFADFEVCPLEPEHAGVMQAACIESAKNIVIEKE